MITRIYYCCLAVAMKGGGTETRRFRVSVDPRAIPESEQPGFLAWAVRETKIDHRKVADHGAEPAIVLSVWDTEAECKAAYDEGLRLLGPMEEVRS